jgi:hypothetical protein
VKTLDHLTITGRTSGRHRADLVSATGQLPCPLTPGCDGRSRRVELPPRPGRRPCFCPERVPARDHRKRSVRETEGILIRRDPVALASWVGSGSPGPARGRGLTQRCSRRARGPHQLWLGEQTVTVPRGTWDVPPTASRSPALLDPHPGVLRRGRRRACRR